MATWEYRVLKSTHRAEGIIDPIESYSLVEVMYDEDETLHAWRGVRSASAQSVPALKAFLTDLTLACNKEPLNREDLTRAMGVPDYDF